MPIYEYLCRQCGKVFEHLVFGPGEAVRCPECHSPEVEKLLSACTLKTGCTTPVT